jgi:hypothetical protein
MMLRALALVIIVNAAAMAAPSLGPLQFDPTRATWRVRATDHFEIYYTQARDLDAIAREAEHAYARVSRDLGRQVSAKVPLILLPTSRDLPKTEQEAAVIVRASGAPPRDHLLLPVEPGNGDREKRLAHELTHIFEFDQRHPITAGLRITSRAGSPSTGHALPGRRSANSGERSHDQQSR